MHGTPQLPHTCPPASASVYFCTASAALPALIAALPASRILSAVSSELSSCRTSAALGSPTSSPSSRRRRCSWLWPAAGVPAGTAGKKALGAAAAPAAPPAELAAPLPPAWPASASSAASSASSWRFRAPPVSPSCQEHCACRKRVGGKQGWHVGRCLGVGNPHEHMQAAHRGPTSVPHRKKPRLPGPPPPPWASPAQPPHLQPQAPGRALLRLLVRPIVHVHRLLAKLARAAVPAGLTRKDERD